MNDEAPFLAAVQAAPADDAPRLVYADWLDDRGRPGGAFLRLECQLAGLADDDPKRAEVLVRLAQASRGVDPAWVEAVARVPVENCGVRFRFRCPQKWEQLQPTGAEGVRYCGECQQQVFFCHTLDIARTHAALGECVAVDPRLMRGPGDLQSAVWDEALIVGLPGDISTPLRPDSDDPREEPPRRRGWWGWWRR